MTMDKKQILTLVNKYKGIPYHHAGRDLNGLDCLGLVYLFYKDCGIKIPDGDGKPYPKDWYKEDPERYVRGISHYGNPAPLDELKPLDLVYFRMFKYISHTGIMIDSEYFIHIHQNSVVHISHLNFIWRKRLAGARRLIN
jgi:cell wall-associated NlpC family hydrolase